MGKPWEQKKLEEIMDFQNGFNGDQTRYGKGIPLISVMDILDPNPITTYTVRNKADLSSNELQRYLVEYGDVLFQRSSENFEDAGRSNIFIDKERVAAFGGFVIRGKRKADYDPYFIRNLLNSTPVRKQITSQAQGAQHINISQDSLAKTLIKIPNNIEQKNIGAFFNQLDRLITLQEQQLDFLKEQKKGLLQKMFPRDKSNVPEIRFPGFTASWEQRKLGEIFEEYSEKNHAELPPLMIVQGNGTILRDESDRKLHYDKASLSNYKMVNKGDFIVHLRSFEGGLEIALNKGIISPAYHTLHGKEVDSRFYYAYFRSLKFIDKDLKPHVYGIRDGRSIDIEGMKTIKIPYPTLDEQQTIGDFIEQLNNLITLHQRKLELLKEQKKGLLQKMFPKEGEDAPKVRFPEFR